MSMLSYTGKRWRQRSSATHITGLFSARNIDTCAPVTLVPPAIFPDIRRACERIIAAMQAGERIGVFGDYDCDGITAVAQLVRYFQRHSVEPWIRLPHRMHDGYGLKHHVVQEIIDAGVTLLITADTGVSAIDEIRLLKEQGVDVIVTDHHTPRQELPLAYATIHPALSKHPHPHPCGSGVVYKLICALEGGTWEDQDTDTALAMFGTVADLVELRGDNRALTMVGLAAFNRLTSGPLQELRERCNVRGDYSATDIAFRIAPRINAAGRMASPNLALQALLHGGEHLSYLDLLNEQRQGLTKELCTRAVRDIDDDDVPPILVSAAEDYPHGIVGLIAGKLTEQYGRPSLVAHIDGDICTASLRSTDAYNITLGLATCQDLLLSYGGHAQAAGCTFELKHLAAITEQLSKDITAHVPDDALVPTLDIDMELQASDVSLQLIEELRQLEPYGQGNPEPVFVLHDVSLEHTRPCGKEHTHLTGYINRLKCVGFTFGYLAGNTEKVDIAVRIERSEWNGKVEPQLVIVDVAQATKKQLAVGN